MLQQYKRHACGCMTPWTFLLFFKFGVSHQGSDVSMGIEIKTRMSFEGRTKSEYVSWKLECGLSSLQIFSKKCFAECGLHLFDGKRSMNSTMKSVSSFLFLIL
mmetsp:Transcript_107369/g.190131  ORF Transcript_107369/g.190131 Transcript_107369/m.190131 type:complete len:103 (-) Transcript_107369:164-472(-)